MVMTGTALSVVVVVRILKCPLCGRSRECRCLTLGDGGSIWQCSYCGREFRLGSSLTAFLLPQEEVVYG